MTKRQKTNRLKMHTPNVSQDNISRIREMFPGCVSEIRDESSGDLRLKVDFDLLRQELSEHVVDGPQERYRMDWPGKRKALALANAHITKTLRPCREESVDFDSTKNLLIKGDNLEALKLLQETYLGKIKMIYIDPPYNTGKDFIYNDDFRIDKKSHEIESEERTPENNRLISNPSGNGRFHTVWNNMLYPRIKLAKNLLSEDGIFFMSLDDNEVHNGLKICEEIFGTRQFVACLPTIMNLKGNNDQFAFAGTHEYTLVFAKEKSSLKVGEFNLNEEELGNWQQDEFGYFKRGANLKATGQNAPRERRPNLFFPIYVTEDDEIFIDKPQGKYSTILPITNGVEMSWRWSKDAFRQNPNDVILVRSKDSIQIYKKQRPNLGDMPSRKPKTIFYKPEYSSGNGTATIKGLLGFKPFDAPPKPLILIEDLIQIGCPDGGIILDFFAGTGTTGHAAFSFSQKTGKEISHIMIQLDEKIPMESKAGKEGYNSIFEITRDRLRLAGEKVIESASHPDWNRDVGFRVLKVDTSNMKDVYYRPDELNQKDILDAIDNVEYGRTNEDLLFQVLVDWGVDLTLPIQQKKVQRKTVFFIDGNALVACFEKGVTEKLVRDLAKYKPVRAVFHDSSFESDSLKINIDQIFRQLSPHTEFRSI